MRQRLSSEPDRYRGRRRVPTPPRNRYAAVVTTAFIGAGAVALGAAAMLPDAKAVSPSALSELENAAAASDLAERGEALERSSRDDDRALTTSLNQQRPDVWLLPLKGYKYTSPYGMRWGRLHAGVDLSAREGTPFQAVHAGTVKLARWYGGYGNAIIIDHGNGVETVYGHSSKLLVHEGEQGAGRRHHRPYRRHRPLLRRPRPPRSARERRSEGPDPVPAAARCRHPDRGRGHLRRRR